MGHPLNRRIPHGPKLMPNPRFVSLFLLAAGLITASSGSAQTTGSTSSVGTSPVVELSPFVVNAEEDTGYAANSTLAGSRLKTNLIDTASAIDVLTPELLRDIGATSLDEAVEFATNSDVDVGVGMTSDNEQFGAGANRINIRGLEATRTRNYLPISYGADLFNVERLEENRGPNSILFGIGSASGIVNINTKRAQLGRTFRSGSFAYNVEGGLRATLDLNQPLHDRVALRVNAAKSDLDDPVAYHAGRKFDGLSLAATVKLTDRIRVTGEAEWGHTDAVVQNNRTQTDGVSNWLNAPVPRYTFNDFANPGVTLPAYGLQSLGTGQRGTYVDNNGTAVNFRSLHQSTGNGLPLYENNSPELWDPRVNAGGPGQLLSVDYRALGATMELKINPQTYLELSVGHNDSRTSGHGFIMENLKGSPNAYYSDKVTVNPYAGQLYFEGQWRQFDRTTDYSSYRATLSHEKDLGKFGNYRLALMAEKDDEEVFNVQRRETWVDANGVGLFNSSPENANNTVYRRHYITTEGDWESYYASSPATDGLLSGVQLSSGQTGYTTWTNQAVPQTNEKSYHTGLIGLQARYFDNRIVFGLGYRYDKLVNDSISGGSLRDPVTNERMQDPSTLAETQYVGRTKTAGVVFHLNKNLRLMYNQSDNFGLPADSRKEYPDFSAGAPTSGKGRDFGLGYTLWEGKISGRISRFETDSKNVYVAGLRLTNYNDALRGALVSAGVLTQAQSDAMFIDGTGGVSDQHVEGYEFSVTANITRNWRLTARYAFTDGYTTNSFPDQKEFLTDPNRRLGGFGGLSFYENPAWANLPLSASNSTTIAQYISDYKDLLATSTSPDGVTLPKNVRHKANLLTRYTFSDGPVKGLYVGGAVRYAGATDLGFGTDTSGNIIRLIGDPKVNLDGFLGYTFQKFWGLQRLSFQLNVKNVLNNTDYIITRRNSNGTIRDVVYPQPRLWRVTANYSF